MHLLAIIFIPICGNFKSQGPWVEAKVEFSKGTIA